MGIPRRRVFDFDDASGTAGLTDSAICPTVTLGEVRRAEARTLLDLFNTGHSGSLATIHANSAEKALCRFANLVMRVHAQTTFSDTEAEIAEAVDFVVHMERQPGRRTIRKVLRLIGYDRRTEQFRFEAVPSEQVRLWHPACRSAA